MNRKIASFFFVLAFVALVAFLWPKRLNLFYVADRITEQNQLKEYSFLIHIDSVQDGYVQVIPDDCLLSLKVNDKEVDSPFIPFCDYSKGRIIDLRAHLIAGQNRIEATIRNTYGVGGLTLSGTHNPWKKIILIGICFFLVGAGVVASISRLLPDRPSAQASKYISRGIACLIVFNAVFLIVQHGMKQNWITVGISVAALCALWIWMLPTLALPLHCKRVKMPMWAVVSLMILVLAYIAYVTLGTIAKHHRLESYAYDLGIQENLIWNTLNGNFFHSSVMGNIQYLGNHTSLIYLLILPLYFLHQSTETLLFVQALVLGAAAIPLAVWATKVLGNYWFGILFGVAYLLNPLVQGGAFYDFHELCFVPLLLFSALCSFSYGKNRFGWFSILLLLLVKEDVSIVVFTLGCALLASLHLRTGFQLILVSLLSYFYFQNVMIPELAGESRSYVHYFRESFPGADSPQELFDGITSNPLGHVIRLFSATRENYLVQAYGSFAGVALLSPVGIIASLYGMALGLFGSNKALYTQGFQYAFNFVPMIILGTVLTLAALRQRGRYGVLAVRVLGIAVLAASLLMFRKFGMVAPSDGFRCGFSDYQGRDAIFSKSLIQSDLIKLVSTIPQDASVIASERLVPHLARRIHVESTRRVADGIKDQFDYLVTSRSELHRLAAEKKSIGARFQVVAKAGDYLLLQKTYPENAKDR